MRARHYDPNSGRFLQHDPIGTKDDINLYRYVANNPMKYVDRDGLYAKSALIFMGGVFSEMLDDSLDVLILLGDNMDKAGQIITPIAISGGCVAGGVTVTATTAGLGIFLSPAGCATGAAIGGAGGSSVILAGNFMKAVGYGGKELKEQLSNKKSKEKFHRDIKPGILKDAGKENYINKVGKNPDIDIKDGRIILKGNGEYKGKTHETDLKSEWYFNN